MTWKQNGIRHDSQNNRVRLSKGRNHKEYARAREYILVEYETAPGVSVENLQQVRAVSDQAKGRWELHLVQGVIERFTHLRSFQNPGV